MKAIVVGGGKVGYFLTKTLINKKIDVVMIERNETRANQLSDELGIEIICGNGADMNVLDDAGIYDAQIIAAVSGSDEENLVICKLANVLYPKKKTIARINNPKNIEMFKALGVDSTVCSTKVIADLINYEMTDDKLKVIQTFERGKMLLVELNIEDKNQWINKEIQQLPLPKDLIIVSIIRGEMAVFPRGATVVLPGDHILMMCSNDSFDQLRQQI
jgi:trk system potassium uptake protein